MNCIHCNAEVSGKFCSQCGQRIEVRRISFKEGWLDFWARIYGFDGMFPRTLKDLTFRPGEAAREFIGGNRVKHYGPVGYFFLMITLFLLLLSMLDIDFNEFIMGTRKWMPIEERGSYFEKRFPQLVSDNLKLFAFIMVPFQATTARYLFFRKSGFNLLENMVLNFYLIGHLYWFSIASALYFKLFGGLVSPILQLSISLIYIAFGYTSFIAYQSKIKTFFKGVGVYLVSQVLFVSFIIMCVLIYVLILAWLDPDSLKMFKPVQ